jgi:hypothetical protein
MSPYRESDPASTPPRFSPLRPFAKFAHWVGRLFWWCIASETWSEPYASRIDGETRDPTLFGVLGVICAFGCLISVFLTVFGADRPGVVVYVCGGFVIVRSWCRAAMHLDVPASAAWWKLVICG